MSRVLPGWIPSTLGPAVLMALLATPGHAATFALEIWDRTGGTANPFARDIYLCRECTPEQFDAVPLPGPSWEKNSTATDPRVFLPDASTNTPPTPPGIPLAYDWVPEIPGDDHFLIAQGLSGALLGVGNQGLMSTARVARGTTLTYLPGRVVHKLTDPAGDEWVMFLIQQSAAAVFDPTVLDGLAGMSVPAGWSYSSEVLANTLTVTTPGGIAEIFTTSGHWTFQKMVVPEPGVAMLLGAALLAAGARRFRKCPLAIGALLAAISIGLAPAASAAEFNLQFYELTGGSANPAARNVYLCGEVHARAVPRHSAARPELGKERVPR